MTTLIFILLMILGGGVKSVATNIVIPMIADASDYETYRTGRYVPGMMGTIFSFVDKFISSFATTFVGIGVALIGFKTALPTVDDPATPQIFWLTMFFFIGIPLLGWIASIIAMKFYPLDEAKMKEIQAKISLIKSRCN